MKKMRGQIIYTVLKTIGDMGVAGADLFIAFLNVGYGVLYGKMGYELSKARKQNAKDAMERKMRQKYNLLVYKLKREGIIEVNTKQRMKRLSLTKKGREKLLFLRNLMRKRLPSSSYSSESSDRFIIVVFDVPEKERRKRNWLREALRSLNLRMVQKSVWVGKAKIPADFISDLSSLKMLDYVEIFEVSKTGSLKHVV